MSKPVIKLNQPVRITSIEHPDAFANKKDRAKLVGTTGHFTSLTSNLYEDDSVAGDFVFSDGIKTFFHRVFVKPVREPSMQEKNLPQLITALPSLPLDSIAEVILRDWKAPNFAAKPYLNAMGSLSSLSSKYGADDGRTIVLYFLSNAAGWRGPVAKAVKKELHRRLKGEGK